MSAIKTIIKRMLPLRVREKQALYQRRQEQARRDADIAESNKTRINELIGSHLPVKLEFGAGTNRGIDGWTYVDVNRACDLTLNLRDPIPFPDNSVSMIYSSHLLEHFEYPDLIHFLHECLRILKPGDNLLAAVPNARIYLNAYHNPEAFNEERFCAYEPAYNYHSTIDYVNYIAYMDGEHKFMFDEDNILSILTKAGFKDATLREMDTQLDLEERDHETIYVEARA